MEPRDLKPEDVAKRVLRGGGPTMKTPGSGTVRRTEGCQGERAERNAAVYGDVNESFVGGESVAPHSRQDRE